MARSRIAVCSWSLRPQNPGDLLHKLEDLAIPAVQLALNPILDQPDAWGRCVAILRSAGVDIISGMMAMRGEDYTSLQSIARTGGVRPDGTWPANLALATRVAQLAAACDIDLVTFHAGFMPEDDGDREFLRMLDRLHVVADAFERRHVALALESGQETADTLVRVLFKLDRAVIGVNFDPGNMILYGMGDPVQSLRKLLPRVRQVHVKDAIGAGQPGTWGREVPVGDGAVDWPAFFEIARRIEPPVHYVIEREHGQSWKSDILRARDVIAGGIGVRK